MSDEQRTLGKTEESMTKLDELYSITLNSDGVYLSVHAPKGDEVRVTESIVFEDLKKRNISNYNKYLTIKAISEASGQPVKIAEHQLEEAEPEINVVVARDRMEAELEVIIPENARSITLDHVMSKINESGVVYGIDHAAIQRAFEHPGIKVICARGQRASDGASARIEYRVNVENKGRPAEQEDGRVDFKNLNMFTTVFEGEILAEKIPPQPGTPGIDVLGNSVSARPGKDILLPVGKNVKVVDGCKLVAAISGQVVISNNKISVVPLIEVKEDVDLSTGNIEFVGNVIVRGSVQAGFTVRAQGNVEVFGNVNGGTIEGKNVNVRMGIQGMHRGYIKATENVLAKFIENADVSAGQNIVVTDVILHSNVSAGKRVIVEGRRGLIAGGIVMAGEEVRAKIAGTHMATSTEIEVGVNPVLRQEYESARKEIKKIENSLDQTLKAISILKTIEQSKLSPEKKEMLLKLTKAQFHLVRQVENYRNRIIEIELAFEEMKSGRIRIADIIYPGVKIVVGKLIKPIREQQRFVSFYAENGEIKIGSFK